MRSITKTVTFLTARTRNDVERIANVEKLAITCVTLDAAAPAFCKSKTRSWHRR
ncbi:MAG: hypothetical protein WDM89_07330 [Rhizomicrobium sp.]